VGEQGMSCVRELGEDTIDAFHYPEIVLVVSSAFELEIVILERVWVDSKIKLVHLFDEG